MNAIVVNLAYDDEARVWFVETSTLPGLRTEAETVEALRAKLPGLVEDLVEANGLNLTGEVHIDVVARTHAIANVAA
jgi:predicted RNase H-like HicB family nuclease